MAGQPVYDLSSGTEETADHHYLVFSPGTAPLGRETDALLSECFRALRGGIAYSLDLILRVSDPQQLHVDPEMPYWRQVRVYPALDTLQPVGDREFRFVGRAFELDPDGTDGDAEFIVCVTIKITDQEPGSRIGELVMSSTTSGGIA